MPMRPLVLADLEPRAEPTTTATHTVVRQARHDRLALRIGLAVLVLAGLAVLAPFAPWLMLAAWFASLARPALTVLARLLGGPRGAAVLTLALFIIVVGPVGAVGLVIVLDAVELWRSMSASESGADALRALVADGGGGVHVPDLADLAQAHVTEALGVASGLAQAAASATIGLFVFFTASYTFLAEGPRAFAWLERNTPVANRHIERLAAAFQETGRGLLVSVGLSGLVQATLATVTFLLLGVSHALVLGLAAFFASLIPSVGTALVWVPVAIGLWIPGQSTRAVVPVTVGVPVIPTADNLLRPVFARWGALDLHGLVVLVAMLGGLEAFGPWGLLLGPLVVRLAIETLRIARDERALS